MGLNECLVDGLWLILVSVRFMSKLYVLCKCVRSWCHTWGATSSGWQLCLSSVWVRLCCPSVLQGTYGGSSDAWIWIFHGLGVLDLRVSLCNSIMVGAYRKFQVWCAVFWLFNSDAGFDSYLISGLCQYLSVNNCIYLYLMLSVMVF